MAKKKNALAKAVPISDLEQGNLWVLYGKSGSGKTALLGTFPKPLCYLKIGDDGHSTIANVKGINVIEITDTDHLNDVCEELKEDDYYKSVGCDTFGLLMNEWTHENAVQRNRRMSQQMWGDLKVDTEELIRTFRDIAKSKIVVLTCHQVSDDSIEGLEDEILPEIRPNVSKGARSYLEGMANYGVHTVIRTKEKTLANGDTKKLRRYAAHVGANAYYWTKVQVSPKIEVPEVIYNPTYKKIMKALKEERTDG